MTKRSWTNIIRMMKREKVELARSRYLPLYHFTWLRQQKVQPCDQGKTIWPSNATFTSRNILAIQPHISFSRKLWSFFCSRTQHAASINIPSIPQNIARAMEESLLNGSKSTPGIWSPRTAETLLQCSGGNNIYAWPIWVQKEQQEHQ